MTYAVASLLFAVVLLIGGGISGLAYLLTANYYLVCALMVVFFIAAQIAAASLKIAAPWENGGYCRAGGNYGSG